MGAPVLTIHKNGLPVRSLTLEEGEAVLGRSEGCVIRLDDRAVSRQHAVIKAGPSGIRIEKKSHLAPLLVNGSECETATLKEGDEVLIGPFVLKLAVPAESPRQRVESHSLVPEQSEVDSGQEPAPRLPSSPEFPGAGDASGTQILEGVGADGAISFESSISADPAPLSFGTSEQVLSVEEPSSGAVDIQMGELSSIIDEDAKTRMLAQETLVKLKIKFSPGAASIEMKEFDQAEISMGRGKGCDIVLNDKKASRKHLVIRRSGQGVDTVFTIRDLESANGIYVNGARVTEHLLSGDDVVRVGDTEFLVQAVMPGYDRQAANFLKIDHEMPIHEESHVVQGMARVDDVPSHDGVGGGVALAGGSAMASHALPGMIPGMGEPLSQVAGMGSVSSGGKMSLLDRYRALPQRSRFIYIAFVGMLLYTLVEEFAAPPVKPAKQDKVAAGTGTENKKGPAPQAGGDSNLPTFEQLKPELQKFVESQYNLALEYFRNRDYDRSLYEVRKIFQYVADYRDARDLERYSVESKQRVQAQEEERRRKEVEQANKARVAKLIIEVEGHMARKEYVQARELFAEIIAIEPDNAQIAGWKKEIESFEEAQERERQLRQFEAESKAKAEEILASGNRALQAGLWFKAIDIYKSVFELDLKDRGPVARAQKGIARARAGVAALRDPLIEEGVRLEQESAYSEAYKKFAEAGRMDPSSRDARAGMDRVRGFIRDRAKQLYTEAVLAESYSDFSLARSRFEQLLQIAPPDDPYYERAKRKLSRYVVPEAVK